MKNFRYHPDARIYIQNEALSYQDTVDNFSLDCTANNLSALPAKPSTIREYVASEDGLSYAITQDCAQVAFDVVGQPLESYFIYIAAISDLIESQIQRNPPVEPDL